MSLIGKVQVGIPKREPTFSDKEIGIGEMFPSMESYKEELDRAREDFHKKTKELERATAKLKRLKGYWLTRTPKGNALKNTPYKADFHVLTSEGKHIIFKPEHLQYALLGSDPEKSLDFVLENYPEPILIENL